MRLLVRALAALTPLALMLALAGPSSAYLHVNYACMENIDNGFWSFETGATIRDHRKFAGLVGGQARHMTADDLASRWGGWGNYYGGTWGPELGPTPWIRIDSGTVRCDISHTLAWLDWETNLIVEVKGSDNQTNGTITSMRVLEEWDLDQNRHYTAHRVTNWDACAGDGYC